MSETFVLGTTGSVNIEIKNGAGRV